MCLIAFTLGQHPDFPLVVAANRDEFFRRPTAAMDWWTTEQSTGQSTGQGTEILAGRDLQSGGTWLAVARDGRVSAVTNVREGSPETGQTSRGELPIRALSEPIPTLTGSLSSRTEQYAGFNLVHLNEASGWHYSNRDAHPGRRVHRGAYGLSNHLLQTPWPKLLRLRQNVADVVASSGADPDQLHQALIPLLQDTTPAPDDLLPDTGVGLETERFLSSPFIVGDAYGTRATTIVSVSRHGEITVSEQSWGPKAQVLEYRRFQWQR